MRQILKYNDQMAAHLSTQDMRPTRQSYRVHSIPDAVIGAAAAKGYFVRKADIGVECSKGLLPAISTSGGVAASYGSGYALEVMREHMERMW